MPLGTKAGNGVASTTASGHTRVSFSSRPTSTHPGFANFWATLGAGDVTSRARWPRPPVGLNKTVCESPLAIPDLDPYGGISAMCLDVLFIFLGCCLISIYIATYIVVHEDVL